MTRGDAGINGMDSRIVAMQERLPDIVPIEMRRGARFPVPEPIPKIEKWLPAAEAELRSRKRVHLLVRQIARHNGDWNRIGTRGRARHQRHEWAGTFF
jgi:hypothetical protein